MAQTFPTYLELTQFIKEKPLSTICGIRDKFNQTGKSVVCIKKPGCKKKELVLAYGINKDFFEYLQSFMKEDFVVCSTSEMACLISDSTVYTGEGEFLPIVLSIDKVFEI